MNDLKIIKKKYGEKMMHLCRELFPSLLEKEGLLSSLMLDHFEPNKSLYEDIVKNDKQEKFKNYIYSFIDVERGKEIITKKTPFELLSEAGYNLYECKTEEEIQSFKKYYAIGEELCTFNGGRLNSCYVFFAVKKDVDNIRRENFKNPRREDLYGTSVISIQFRKTPPNIISIKNRYNHKVNNPDNTFNNNLDNIILGLSESFKDMYGFEYNISDSKFEIPGYVEVNGKFYKYNYEKNNKYYCPNNIIIDNFAVIDKYAKEPERYIVMDYFIIDLKEKIIELYDYYLEDSFIGEIENIENIEISKDKNTGNKNLEITYDNGKKTVIVINKLNQMIEYHNDNLTKMPNRDLIFIENLEILDTPNLEEIGDDCLTISTKLQKINIPKLIRIGNASLKDVDNLKSIVAPNLEVIGDFSFWTANGLEKIIVPRLKKIGYCVLTQAIKLEHFEADNLLEVKTGFLREAYDLISFKAPKLKELPSDCLNSTYNLTILDISNLITMGGDCFGFSKKLISFKAPNLVEMGDGCLNYAKSLKEFYAPKLTTKGNRTLTFANNLIKYNDAYRKYEMEKIENIGDEVIIKMDKTDSSLIDKLNKILKSNLYRIKEFKNKIIEGVRNR